MEYAVYHREPGKEVGDENRNYTKIVNKKIINETKTPNINAVINLINKIKTKQWIMNQTQVKLG